jgi:hypothetical protein
MSDLLQPASLASWPELGAELPASSRQSSEIENKSHVATVSFSDAKIS